ncbi:flavodoxin [Frankia sp. Mgl5]|uniref:flavodoxin n=1 Tax=Frankia sp. Mgl5 TaxID=2933793 RepID=UPI00201086EC|nr:flavodoxin [Frankia sp. Mgl5]
MNIGSQRPAVLGRRSLLRRSLLRGALGAGATVLAGVPVSGCSAPSPRRPAPSPSARPATPAPAEQSVLLAYFSRAGENYYYGGRNHLDIGNTEALAGMISTRVRCDVHRIEPADPYPDDYEQTVGRNVREQNADARPAIANPLRSIERYDTVLLGSPIWNVRAPMIMSTFTESLDFSGKTVLPVTTYAMSGLGTTERDYAASCPGATIGAGLAVRGEEVAQAGADVDVWLRRVNLL